jgi:HEAT repeat protein
VVVAPRPAQARNRLPLLVCLGAGGLGLVGIGALLLVLALAGAPPSSQREVARQDAVPARDRAEAPVQNPPGPQPQTDLPKQAPVARERPPDAGAPEAAARFVGPPEPPEPPAAEARPAELVGPLPPPVKPVVAVRRPTDPRLVKLSTSLPGLAKPERLAALKTLGNQGNAAWQAVAAVGEFLGSSDVDIGNQTALTLAQIGPDAVPTLARALASGNATVRHRAAWALSLFGPEGSAAVPALTAALSDKNSEVRSLAATALGEIGPDAVPACQALVRALADPSPAVQAQAAVALQRLGPGAVEPLAAALTHDEAVVRRGAAQALRLHGTAAQPAVPQLAAAVKDADPGVRLAALAALGAIGPEAREAQPALVEALKTQHLDTQLQAFAAILLISSDDPDKMAALLRQVTQTTRWATPYLLAQFGPRAKDAVKPLITLLEDPDAGVRMSAALALGHLGPVTAAEAIDALKKCLQDPAPPVRMSAAIALGRVDDRQREAAIRAMENTPLVVEKVYRASQARLALLNRGRPGFNPAALKDPVLQAQYEFIVNTFIASMLIDPTCKGECMRVTPVQTAVRDVVARLGPEAVPAMVRGFNLSARYNLGFT